MTRKPLAQLRTHLWSLAFIVGCAKAGPEPSVTIDGSSTVFPITDAVAKRFQQRDPVKIDVKVPVGVSGTHGGFLKFCAGKIDICDASRPINKAEAELCAQHGVEYIEAPIAYDGLVVVVSAKNSWATDITTDELKRIWAPEAERTITRWIQVRASWPDKELHLYGPGVDSGTYDYFTQAIVHREHKSRTDFTSSEDDDALARSIESDELALGYFGYAYLLKSAGKLRSLGVDDGNPTNGSGAIAPSPDTVRSGTYQPLSRPLFIYVSKSALKRREVELFVGFYLSKGASYVSKVGYVALPDTAYRLAHDRVIARRTGSMFDGRGSQVGLSIEELLQQEQPQSLTRSEPLTE